ncbi:MAG: hypothetical protein ACI3XZ_01495, partial [Butyricicoccus sp.]
LAMLFDRFSLRKANAPEASEAAEQPEDELDELPPEPVEEKEVSVQEEELPVFEEVSAAFEPPAEMVFETVTVEKPEIAEQPETVEETEEIPDEPVESMDVPEAAEKPGDSLDDLSLAELVDRFQRRIGIPSVEDIMMAPQNEENNADGEGEHEQTDEETEAPEQPDRN